MTQKRRLKEAYNIIRNGLNKAADDDDDDEITK